MRQTIVILLTAALLISAAVPALAWRSVRAGDKNFERAWRAYTSKQTDKANRYFTDAADDYGQALKEDPPSRTTRFPTTLIKAGISFYQAKRYLECVDTMKLTHRRNERIWEADLFSALAYARLGDSEKTLKELALFMEALSSQRLITSAVTVQVKGLEDGSISLDSAANTLESVTQQQFVKNVSINNSPQKSTIPNERCTGNYWWRYNATPCNSGGFIAN